MKEKFNIAFINRIDNVFVFNRLTKENVGDITIKKLNDIIKKYSNIEIGYSENLINEIVERCNYFDYGARRIDKLIDSGVNNLIVDAIINKESSVYINCLNNEKNTTLM